MENPLLALTSDSDLSRIQPDQVAPAISALLGEANQALERIAQAEPASYDTTLGALERSLEPLEHAMSVVEHLESVATTPELRRAHDAALPEVSEFFSSVVLHAGVYRALSRYAETAEARALTGARRRLLTKTLSDFRRNGAELGTRDKAELLGIDRKLSELANRFSQNVLDATNAFELCFEDRAVLAGLPESALAEAERSAREKGRSGYRLTLQPPSVLAVLTHAERRDLREQIWRANGRRATSGVLDNTSLIDELLELRRRRAKVLGFAHFADLVMDDRMAKTGAMAASFIEELKTKTQAAFERENRELETFRLKLLGPGAPRMEPWDVAYYAERKRRAEYAFDEEALRPYFAAERVLEGAFELARRLYGVEITRDPAAATWDESVRSYRLLTPEGRLAARFYVDLYYRENKRGGAWMGPLITRVPPDANAAVLCTNLAPPTSTRPSLITHREVETIFHEFGHLLHHCLSEVSVRSLSGTRVAHDFVELPSQIMENWCFEREGLALFARHYQTEAPLPDELFQTLTRVRTFRAANDQMRQLGFAALDLALHMAYTGERAVLDYAREVMQPYAPAPLPPDYAMVAQFVHLFGHPVGYAAGYYAYKWAEVLDADAFGRFKNEGLFSREVGRQFFDHVLSRGDSEEPAVLFERFRGRAARLDALLERLGLTQPPIGSPC